MYTRAHRKRDDARASVQIKRLKGAWVPNAKWFHVVLFPIVGTRESSPTGGKVMVRRIVGPGVVLAGTKVVCEVCIV